MMTAIAIVIVIATAIVTATVTVTVIATATTSFRTSIASPATGRSIFAPKGRAEKSAWSANAAKRPAFSAALGDATGTEFGWIKAAAPTSKSDDNRNRSATVKRGTLIDHKFVFLRSIRVPLLLFEAPVTC